MPSDSTPDNGELVVTPGGPRPKEQVTAVPPGQVVEGGPEGFATVAEAPTPPAAPAAGQYVLTPGGYRDRSLVYQVAPETLISGAAGEQRLLEISGGRVSADRGAIRVHEPGVPVMPNNIQRTAPGISVPALGTGWIVDTRWNRPGAPVTSFRTTWTVPPAPSSHDGQTIFLFNGLENDSMILQPVLQWGPSAAGGGNNWAVASWFADGQSGQAFHSSLSGVTAGEQLVGVMTLTDQLVTLGDTSPRSPALASLNGILYLAWKGDGNDFLNVMPSFDNGNTFAHKLVITSDTSPQAPALCAHNGGLYIAWKGDGNDHLNVARVTLQNGIPTGITGKVILQDTSQLSPCLASLNGVLYLGWKGDGNDFMNVMPSFNNGASFGFKLIVPNETTPQAPGLCAHEGNLYLTWKGDGNDHLNVAQVDRTAGRPTGTSHKVILGDTSPVGPALASLNGVLYLSWKGDGNDFLNVMSSVDGGATFGHKLISFETSPISPTICAQPGGLFIGWKGDGNDLLNVAQVRVDRAGGVYGLFGSGNLMSYHCQFEGISNSALDIRHVAEVWQATETLEAYGLQKCSDYPNTTQTNFTGIDIQAGFAEAPVNWGVFDQVTDCGQSAVVVRNGSPNGEVDLHYHK